MPHTVSHNNTNDKRKGKRLAGGTLYKENLSPNKVNKKYKKNRSSKVKPKSYEDGLPKYVIWNVVERMRKGPLNGLDWDIDGYYEIDQKTISDTLYDMFQFIDAQPEFDMVIGDVNKPKRMCAYRAWSIIFNLRDREPLPEQLVEDIREEYPSKSYVGYKD